MATKRKDGRLQKAFRVDGKTYFVYGRTAKELFDAEREKRDLLATGQETRKNPTLNQYRDRWTAARSGTVSENTLRTQETEYKTISAIHIPSAARTFGEIRIKEITIDDLRTLQTELLKSRTTNTVNAYMAYINHILSDAMKERVIDYNPCCLIKTLKRTEESARDTIHRALSEAEIKAFFDCDQCKECYFYNVFRFALFTGMRVGEIGALKYSDIRDGIIHVERTITHTESGSFKIGDTAKTKAGRREIPVNDQIREVIAAQKELNAALFSPILRLNDTIFKSPRGDLLNLYVVDKALNRICKAIKVEPFTMHAFRATFATRAIESRMNPKTLQEILGHTNFNLTMSLYGHALTDTKRAEMDALQISI